MCYFLVCVDSSIRLNINSLNRVTTLEICSEDRWISVDSTLRISDEENPVINDFQGNQTASNTITLLWESLGSTARYEAVCSNGHLTSTLQISGSSTSAMLTVLPSSEDYSCCLTAYKQRTLFNLVEFTRTECVSVEVSPEPTGKPETERERGFDETLAYALGGLSWVVVVAILLVIVAIGCFCAKLQDQTIYNNVYVIRS